MPTRIPNATSPILCNAPMFGTANGALAAAVSKAGGFGFIGAGLDFSVNSSQMAGLDAELLAARKGLGLEQDSSATLPVGVGFLTFHKTASNFPETVIPILRRHKPAAVWLFAPDPSVEQHVHEQIIQSIHSLAKELVSDIAVFVQVGSVNAAREAVNHGADVIVAQGSDAGGHQFAANSGIVSLVPEVRDMLDAEFASRNISLLAAGGIVDGRGLAAALVLGADGAVMGTRFITATESLAGPEVRQAVINAVDGGSSTIKSTFHDDILDMSFWPKRYDGRAIIGQSYQDFLAGMPLEENIEKYKAAASAQDMSRTIVWAGSGVGLIKSEAKAGDIVKSVREKAAAILNRG